MSISPDRAPFGSTSTCKHGIDIPEICRKPGRLACRYIMKVVHVVRQSSAKLIYPRHQGLEMVSVLNAGICNLALCYSYFMPEKNPPYQKLKKAIEKLGVHDHLCLLYENTQEQFAAIVPFMRVGLERGGKVRVYRR